MKRYLVVSPSVIWLEFFIRSAQRAGNYNKKRLLSLQTLEVAMSSLQILRTLSHWQTRCFRRQLPSLFVFVKAQMYSFGLEADTMN
ncbi:hypothetical protein GCM10011533_01820 [Streptosporangium jomthongense]|nr:hypothetical protein GCM10011533_01820 [Streptosporangium jomthongense]